MPGPMLSIAIKHGSDYLWFEDKNDEYDLKFRQLKENEIWAPNLRFLVPIGCKCFIQTYNRKIISFDNIEGGNLAQVKSTQNGISDNDMFNLEFTGPKEVRIKASNSFHYWKRNKYNLIAFEYNDILMEYDNTTFEIENIFI